MLSNLDYLTGRLKLKDKKTVISTLTTLRSKFDGKTLRYQLNNESFKLIAQFLNQPNLKILNYALSILANLCLHETYRRYFLETNGVQDLMLILDSIESEDILCRAWRLIGNLALSPDLCRSLVHNNVSSRIAVFLARLDEFSSATRTMLCRALRKSWLHKAYRSQLMTDPLMESVEKCLMSTKRSNVQPVLEMLTFLLSKPKAFSNEKNILERLVKLSQDENLYQLCIKCLSVFIDNHSVIAPYLEGSGIAELFILHVQVYNRIDEDVMQAFLILCTQSAVRCKVKEANLFPELIQLGRGPNVPILLQTLKLFQYDPASVFAISQSENLMSVLVEHVTAPHAVDLLLIIAKQDVAVPTLVTNDNLEIFIEHPQCLPLLYSITKSKKYFKSILLSGKVWAISAAGCEMEIIGSSGYGEGVVEHYLITGDDSRRKLVSLAVPFLVKPRNFKLLYKLLARHEAMSLILQSMSSENPLSESTAASVVRLAYLFRQQRKEEAEPRIIEGAYQLFLEDMGGDLDRKVQIPDIHRTKSGIRETLEIELDDGSLVKALKEPLCSRSEVLDRMLNGYFVEAGQEHVRLRDCSNAAFSALVKLLEGSLLHSRLDIKTHLELIALTDRLLIHDLSDCLTRAVVITGSNCVEVYLWARTAGHSLNASLLRARAYWELLSSTDQLLPALKMESCREPLLNEISKFLTSCLNDLL